MDDVPLCFCKSVCNILYKSEIWEAKELSGEYGRLARVRFRYNCTYEVIVGDGVIREEKLIFSYTGRQVHAPEEIEAVPKKFVRCVRFKLDDTKNESVAQFIVDDGVILEEMLSFSYTGRQVYAPEEIEEIEAVPKKFVRWVRFKLHDTKKESVAECLRVVGQFPYAFYYFTLLPSSISEAWVDFTYSLRRLETIMISGKLDDDSLRLFGKLVTARKISTFWMFAGACEDGNMELLKTLLCQDQFEGLSVWNDFEDPWKDLNEAAVGELLEFWSENSEKLRRKILILEKNCNGGARQLEQFMLRRTSTTAPKALEKVLKVCSKEECDFLNREYHHRISFVKPSCIYKYEDACEGNERVFYVSFDCASQEEEGIQPRRFTAGYNGQDDLSLMDRTTFLCILFT
uniref:F-box domain-containing protein n=1 Tax=Steinernema glaseri TaxID=37863 RepID=A0A1I7YRM8_9BILA